MSNQTTPDVDPKALEIAEKYLGSIDPEYPNQPWEDEETQALARAITALLRERDKEWTLATTSFVNDTFTPQEAHDILEEASKFVREGIALSEAKLRERDEEIARLRKQMAAFIESERLWAEEFDKDDNPHAANLIKRSRSWTRR